MARIFGLDIRRADKFSSWSVGDSAFADWWLRAGDSGETTEPVTPYTILGLSAVVRAVSVISTTIASLPLRTYERHGDERDRIPSVFDDPFPGEAGQVPFAWVETILIHLLLWRRAFLWHEDVLSDGTVTAYRPIVPDLITKVEVVNGRKRFTYRDADGIEQTVGTERITHIPGPSIDGVDGHPLLYAARNIFSGALAGDKAAATTLRRGIRLAGLLTPGEGEDIDPEEGQAILDALKPKVLGAENAGGMAFINKRLKLDPWTPSNAESQWHETRTEILGEVGRLFGIPPHLLNDIEKQTSWGTGVAEQNLGFSRYTLLGWSTRIEQALTRRLPVGQFVEFDYKGLFQGTPEQESRVLIAYKDAGLMTTDEIRRVLNLPPLTTAQKRELAPPTPLPVNPPQEAIA